MAKQYKNNIFDVIKQIDNKNYQYYVSLTDEQKKEIQPFTLARWISSVDGKEEKQIWYNESVNIFLNKNFWELSKYKDLQWKLLCACGLKGWNKHVWIPLSLSKNDKKYDIIRKYYNHLTDEEFKEKYKLLTDDEIEDILQGLGIEK